MSNRQESSSRWAISGAARASLRRIRHRYKLASAYAHDCISPSNEPISFPPPDLRFRVNGSVSRASFAKSGRRIAGNLLNILDGSRHPAGQFGNLLDFGCGCGRTLRYLNRELPGTELFGADIDPQAIAWCGKNLPAARFVLNEMQPPMEFPDEFFECILGVSVFTHLPENLQNAWLLELQRVSKPGAILILSVHNNDFAKRRLLPQAQTELARKGFHHLVPSTGRNKIDGLPDYYQMTFHTRDYIETRWREYFEIVDYVKNGIGVIQDAVVLKKA